jgi:hypothetical protein
MFRKRQGGRVRSPTHRRARRGIEPASATKPSKEVSAMQIEARRIGGTETPGIFDFILVVAVFVLNRFAFQWSRP